MPSKLIIKSMSRIKNFVDWVIESLDYSCNFTRRERDNTRVKYSISGIQGVDVEMYVDFTEVHKMPGVWTREYDTVDGEFTQLGTGNPKKIISCISAATKDFMEKNQPLALGIHHISMDNEKDFFSTSPNKRARINYPYLSSIPGYAVKVYNRMVSYDRSSYSVIYKPGKIDPLKVAQLLEPLQPIQQVFMR